MKKKTSKAKKPKSTQNSRDIYVNYRANRKRADAVIGQQAAIIRAHTPVYLAGISDDRRGIDMWVPEMTYQVRARDQRYLSSYAEEFTIRRRLPSGRKTEYHNIKKGNVDRLLYGFFGKRASEYHVINLHEFAPYIDELGQDFRNRDGTVLRAYNVADLPEEAVVASTILPGLASGEPDDTSAEFECCPLCGH